MEVSKCCFEPWDERARIKCLESGQLFPNAAGPFLPSPHSPEGKEPPAWLAWTWLGCAWLALRSVCLEGAFPLALAPTGQVVWGLASPFWRQVGEPFLFVWTHEISQMGDGDPICHWPRVGQRCFTKGQSVLRPCLGGESEARCENSITEPQIPTTFSNWVTWCDGTWKSLSRLRLFEAPWTVQSMEFLQTRILEWVANRVRPAIKMTFWSSSTWCL